MGVLRTSAGLASPNSCSGLSPQVCARAMTRRRQALSSGAGHRAESRYPGLFGAAPVQRAVLGVTVTAGISGS